MIEGGVDLHAHTTASDGSLTPEELVALAAESGLAVLAITDHDTTRGVARALQAAERYGIRIVPGVELSTEGPPGKCHMLGLGIDPDNADLNGTLASLSEARRARNELMIRRFHELGIDLTLEEVAAHAPAGANLGRPHFAQALIARGAVGSIREAFDRYLADDAIAYLPKDVLPPAEAIDLIHRAGGIAVVAHPGLIRLGEGETLRERIARLHALGLDGVEVFYPRHDEAQIAELSAVAAELGLIVTGGSDFHGDPKPDIRLGAVHNGRSLPLDAVPAPLL